MPTATAADAQRVPTAPARDALMLGVRALNRTIVAEAEAGLEPLALRIGDFGILSLLRHDDAMSSADLARALGLSPPTVTGMVNALVTRGLVERHLHPRHGRIRTLRLSDEGRSVFAEADRIVAALHGRIQGILGPARSAAFEAALWDLSAGLGGPAPDTDPLWPVDISRR